jgi:hypothetical protein
VSEASLVTGKGSERAAGRPRDTDEPTVTVELESGRGAHLGWAIFGIVGGVVLLWELAIVGKAVGALLLAYGVFRATRFVGTLLHPAGRIAVTDTAIHLPRGLCAEDELVLAPDAVRHAYFLRRSVPWSKAGPILVIETADGAHSFPRDWFASDADQRRIAHALNRRLGRIP